MKKRSFFAALGLLAAFVLWTIAVRRIDVQAIGPRGSAVGFAALNGFVHDFTGVHMALYTVTDWLGLVPAAFGFGFSVLGLAQWIKRKSILKVDHSILILGGCYLVTLAAYLYFEGHIVNYRPVLIGEVLEASYPSSTTLLVMCVMPTAAMQLRERIRRPILCRIVCAAMNAFVVFMVAGRLISGVHWLTDIIGGILFSAAVVMMYHSLTGGNHGQ